LEAKIQQNETASVQDHAKIEAIGLLALLGITGITDVDEEMK
jgi:hypothetical protein